MKNRFQWADIAKGIGIILVVFAHTLIPKLRETSDTIRFIWIFIYNFHMPLFFFISGYLFENHIEKYQNKGKFILGKAKLLMLPYLVFSVFAYSVIIMAMKIPSLAGILSGGGYKISGIKETALGILFYFNHADRHLWFVYSLFIVFTVNILLKDIMKKPAVIVLLAALYVSKAFIRYPAILDYTASDLVFFSLARGMMAKKQNPVLSNPLHIVSSAVIFVTTNMIYSYFYVMGMPSGPFKAILYVTRFLCAVEGIITVCSLSDILARKKAAPLFTELGAYSYDIYLIHAPFLVSGLMGILMAYSPLPPYLCCPVVTIIGIAIPYGVSRFVIRKIPILRTAMLGR